MQSQTRTAPDLQMALEAEPLELGLGDYGAARGGSWVRRGRALVLRGANARFRGGETLELSSGAIPSERDLIHERIDFYAQKALSRMFKGDAAARQDASGMFAAVKSGQLGGIYIVNQGPPALRAQFGLDQPAPVRYWRWLTGLFVGDAGRSYTAQVPVADLLASRLPKSILLAVTTASISVPVAPSKIALAMARTRPVSTIDEAAASAQVIEFLKRYVPAGKSPMCGNSIGQDRRFMARYMPTLEAFFHYRNLDVSTLKELCKRWQPEIYKGFKKTGKHTAISDIYESIDELKYYREHFLVKPAA